MLFNLIKSIFLPGLSLPVATQCDGHFTQIGGRWNDSAKTSNDVSSQLLSLPPGNQLPFPDDHNQLGHIITTLDCTMSCINSTSYEFTTKSWSQNICFLRLQVLVLVLVASLQWISQQRCMRPATKGKTYTAGF